MVCIANFDDQFAICLTFRFISHPYHRKFRFLRKYSYRTGHSAGHARMQLLITDKVSLYFLLLSPYYPRIVNWNWRTSRHFIHGLELYAPKGT